MLLAKVGNPATLTASNIDEIVFAINVLPYPDGIHASMGRRFKNSDDLMRTLNELEEDPLMKAIWFGNIESKAGFYIKSTYKEWQRIDEWADENLR